MELDFEITADDYRVAHSATQARLRRISGHWTLSLLKCMYWLALLGFVWVLLHVPSTAADASLRLLVMSAAAAVIAAFAMTWLRIRRMRRQLAEAAGPFPHSQHLQVRDDGIVIAGRHGENLVRWTAILAAEQWQAHVGIVVRPGAVIVVPNTAFAGEQARTSLIATLRSNIT